MTATPTVGVIVARFQVPDLHDGHRFLFHHVMAQKHDAILVVLGSKRGLPTRDDPLSFEVRKIMVTQTFPTVNVVELMDHPLSHINWSNELDALLQAHFPDWTPVLYGGRDSFKERYTGIHPVRDVPTLTNVSGTAIRESIPAPHSREGRAAVIHSAQNRLPIAYVTTDYAITCGRQILLIGKDAHNGLLSFMGGFVDTSDNSLEYAVERERSEEVGGVITRSMRYVASMKIDDPRYRNTPDGIITVLFQAEFESGEPTAGDDADRFEWVNRIDLIDRLVPWHQPLAHKLLSHWSG